MTRDGSTRCSFLTPLSTTTACGRRCLWHRVASTFLLLDIFRRIGMTTQAYEACGEQGMGLIVLLRRISLAADGSANRRRRCK